MALSMRDMPITREQVHGWIAEWGDDPRDMSREDFIRMKVDELELPDRMVLTTEHDNLEAETDVADMILMDLDSYA